MIFAITLTANLLSAAAVYVAARTLGRRFFEGRIGRRLLNPAALVRLEELYRRHGTWGIFLSRFVPGVRAVVPPFAGIAKLGAARALIPAGIASAIWYGALTVTVVLVAGRLSDVVRLVTGANRIALIAGGVLVTVGVAWLMWRRWRRRRVVGKK
jgi:membrane protein DedA with SNARE-associated domain